MSESQSTASVRLDLKEILIREFIEINTYICPILRNYINLGSNILYNLHDYGNKYIEIITTNKKITCNPLAVIDPPIKETIFVKKSLIYRMTVND